MDHGPTYELPVLPLDDAVLLPGMSVSFPIVTDEQATAVEHAVDGRLVAVPRLDGTLATLGTILRITGQVSLPDGTRAVSVEVDGRAELGSAGAGEPLTISVREIEDDTPDDPDVVELATEYRALAEAVASARGDARRVAAFLRAIDAPGRLADTIGYAPEVPVATKAEVLATIDVTQRLQRAVDAQRERLAEINTRQRILDEVTDGMEKSQRDAILRRQMEAIQRELDGEGGGGEDWRQRIEAAGMPDDARAEAERELSRLERQGDGPEAGMIRSYLEWMVSLPWNTRSDERLEIDEAQRILDADHAGLEKVKERIIEYLAVRKLRRDRDIDDTGNGVILSLVGPPGVGKTSLGESVARATGREFVRISLGGVRDEAEIRGHRRTYIGALPGRIVRALRDAGTRNPVVLLDEIDKVGNDWRGDPTSALLEVLDPAQNH
ncbi:LON peptidase substrate-binding domain-containing protein, partial [Microbacterium sp.]|uniref:LON peptidase substrate-binding domain-containing protein n=1 Tax=Microbacterium sp. TaxID=51671 RepID=UPI003A8C672E